MLKLVLLLLCGMAGFWSVWRIAQESTLTLEAAQHWKRRTVEVGGVNSDGEIEVKWGPTDEERARIPVSPLASYELFGKATLLENPNRPDERRLDGLLDLWFRPLSFALAVVLSCVTAFGLIRLPLGQDLEWREGRWVQPEGSLAPLEPTLAQFRPPTEAWKANLFWGSALGLPLLVGSFFMTKENLMNAILMGWVGGSLWGWLMISAAGHWTQAIRADGVCFEKSSIWGRQRARWDDLGGARVDNVVKAIKDVEEIADHRRTRKRMNTLAQVRMWSIEDRQGREILRFSTESRPASDLEKFVQRVGLETDRRGRREGAPG